MIPVIKFDDEDIDKICMAIRETANRTQLELGPASEAPSFKIDTGIDVDTSIIADALDNGFEGLEMSNNNIADAIRYLADTMKEIHFGGK